MSKFDDQQKLRTALSFHQAGKLDDAASLYRQIISLDRKNYHALHYLGMIEAARRNYDQAKELLHRSLAVEPPNIQFLENFATILFQMGDYEAALEISSEGPALSATNVTLIYLGAISLYKLKRFKESITQFDKLLLLAPNHIAAINERGAVLAELGNHNAALASFEKALILQPRYTEAYINLGAVYGVRKNYDEALVAYDKALTLNLELSDAWLGRAKVLVELKRYDEAESAFDRALALQPDLGEAWLGRGNIALARRRPDEALLAYDKALALRSDVAQAWFGRGVALTAVGRDDDAFAAYDKSVKLKPDLDYTPGARLFAKLSLCDWTNLPSDAGVLLSMIRRGMAATTPFFSFAIGSSAEDQLQCARRQAQDQMAFAALWRGEVYAHDRIRVAYLSADFREHPVAYLMAGLFEHHDRSRFEVTALSIGPDRASPMRDRIKGAVEHFIDAGEQSDNAIAELVRRREIDIVIDLMGLTRHNRLDVLAQRPAPIQVNYLGFSGTTGADFIDYILADATVIPEEHRAFYSEEVVWLPDCYLITDDQRAIAERTPSRSECGLPEDAFVFCCFNNTYKLGPETFKVWMRLLKATPGSVLWLSEANATAQANLRREAEQTGVGAGRLIFAPRLPDVADHLARQRQADLFLDTLPYNAHTTACDALWAGVPLVTCLGTTFVGRVAASLLKAVGLDELITQSSADYEALALRLAHDPASLTALRDKLARNKTSFPLFDTARTTRQIEAAYTTMWQRYQKGETRKPAVVTA